MKRNIPFSFSLGPQIKLLSIKIASTLSYINLWGKHYRLQPSTLFKRYSMNSVKTVTWRIGDVVSVCTKHVTGKPQRQGGVGSKLIDHRQPVYTIYIGAANMLLFTNDLKPVGPTESRLARTNTADCIKSEEVLWTLYIQYD